MDKRAEKDFGVLGLFVLVGIIFTLFFSGFFVFALESSQNLTYGNFTLPALHGNYTTTLNMTFDSHTTLTTTALGALGINATVYLNSSGGLAINSANLWFIMDNTTNANDEFTNSNWSNATVDLTGISDCLNICNLTALVNNGTEIEYVYKTNFTFDSTPPNVSTIVNTVDGGTYNKTIYINVTVNDSTIGMERGSVYINITNSTSSVNYTVMTNRSGNSVLHAKFNATFNTSHYPDGAYTITFIAKDSLNNTNSTESIGISIDNTAPAVTLSSISATSTVLRIGITTTDAISNVGTCGVDRSGAVITGSGSTQYIDESSLTCGTSYAYIVTCNDTLGQSTSTAATSFSTTSCGGGSPAGGSSGTTTTWTNTFTISDEQFTEGYTKELSAKNRVKVSVGGATHHVGVKSVTATSATIEISSDPVQISLDVGEDAKVDVSNDGYYDIYVLLNSITNNKADLTIKNINEAIPEGGEAVSTTGEITTPGETKEKGSSTTLIIVIIILILAAAIGGGVALKKKKK